MITILDTTDIFDSELRIASLVRLGDLIGDYNIISIIMDIRISGSHLSWWAMVITIMGAYIVECDSSHLLQTGIINNALVPIKNPESMLTIVISPSMVLMVLRWRCKICFSGFSELSNLIFVVNITICNLNELIGSSWCHWSHTE